MIDVPEIPHQRTTECGRLTAGGRRADAVVDGLATDFVTAGRLVGAGSAEAAMVRLLPSPLTERELALPVHLMVAAGVVVTTPLDPAAAQGLLTAAADHAEPVDLLVDLARLFAELDRSGR